MRAPSLSLSPRLALALLLLIVLLLPAGVADASDADPVSEGAATDTCRSLPGLPQQGCDTVRSFTHAGAATCRRAGVPDVCTPANGQRIAAAEVQAYATSGTAAAHALQRRLQEDLPLRHATFVATHNSYNSYAYRPTPSRTDANQTYRLDEQLSMDVRRVELDVHTWTDAMTGAKAPILCHATSAGPINHVGCTFEMTLTDGLRELDAWLDANPDELVMIRLETHLDGAAGYDQAAAALQSVIGDHLFLPPAGQTCTKLDLDLTRADIRAGGQVMLVSDCGQGQTWGPMVWDDGAVRVESTARGQDFAYPTCAGIPRTAAGTSYDTRWIRFYDDATLLSSYVSLGSTPPRRVTPADAREWTRCGVNQPAFDHLTPTDGRLAALVWSWDAGQGTDGDCATIAGDTGRFASTGCDAVHPYVCTTGHAQLAITSTVGPADGHQAACAAIGATPAVPRSGYEAQRVVDLGSAGASWIALARDAAGEWMPTSS